MTQVWFQSDAPGLASKSIFVLFPTAKELKRQTSRILCLIFEVFHSADVHDVML